MNYHPYKIRGYKRTLVKQALQDFYNSTAFMWLLVIVLVVGAYFIAISKLSEYIVGGF